MQTKTVVVVGAGIGGQLAARGIKDNYPDHEVVLVGKICPTAHGLFYFNEKIPGVAEQEIKVTYGLLGEGSMEDYQMKSRGEVSGDVKVSSFDKVGKVDVGYMTDGEIPLDGIKLIEENALRIDLDTRKVQLDSSKDVYYDYLVSTVPLKAFLFLTNSTVENLIDQFKSQPVYEKITQSNLIEDAPIDQIKVFYDLSDSHFYRHSSYYHGDDIVRMVSETIKEFEGYDDVARPGKIIPSERLTEFVTRTEEKYGNLILCGRYARWDYHYLVSDTYRDAVEFLRGKL